MTSVPDRMASATRTSSRVNPRRRELPLRILEHRSREDVHGAVEGADLERPVAGRAAGSAVPEKDPGLGNPSPREIPDLRNDIERPVRPFDADPGDRQPA